MADKDAETPDDPWLTLAEIAAELRMSPATIALVDLEGDAAGDARGSAQVAHLHSIAH